MFVPKLFTNTPKEEKSSSAEPETERSVGKIFK
jgi:hypothetical protein